MSNLETLILRQEGPVLFAAISAATLISSARGSLCHADREIALSRRLELAQQSVVQLEANTRPRRSPSQPGSRRRTGRI
jgi:hypothetical protein